MTSASSVPSPCYSFALFADLDPITKQRFDSVKNGVISNNLAHKLPNLKTIDEEHYVAHYDDFPF